MCLDKFIAIQRESIADSGLANYFPTLFVLSRKKLEISVFAEAPDEPELETAVLAWAEQLAGNHDYHLAFRHGEAHFKVIAREGGKVTEQVLEVADGAN